MKAEEIRPITFSDGAVLKIAEVKAGFPSPAADFTGETIDLNRRFGTNKVRLAAPGWLIEWLTNYLPDCLARSH